MNINFEDLPEKIFREEISRKDFLKKCLAAGIAVGASSYIFDIFSSIKASGQSNNKLGVKEAMYYQKMGDSAVKCLLCPNNCVLSDGQRGFCRVRENSGNKLYTLVYELICASHIDPIEKKPLYHVLPGTGSFSVATAGCNSRCKYCQNWTISQRPPEETINRILTVNDLARSARAANCASISYTYTEPIVAYEYVMESSKAAARENILNIIVTGGKINPKPLKELCGYIQAANVDLKGFDNDFLNEVCAQDLDNILETILTLKNSGVWIELTNLIVPTLNDDMSKIKEMSRWIAKNLGLEVPLHFSRFWPQYRLRSLYPTPIETMRNARETAIKEGLRYVYIGNVPETRSMSTHCPGCGKAVISRAGYTVVENHVSSEGKCGFCGGKIAGIWSRGTAKS